MLRKSPRSASNTEAKPSKLLSKEDVDFSPTLKIRDSSRSSISWFSDTLLRFLYARSKKNLYRNDIIFYNTKRKFFQWL